jgi:DNA-binding NarL/FixJ family response regulator
MRIENNAEKEIRVLLTHRHTLTRECIAGLLEEAGFHVVATADREEELVRLAARYNPDILLLDWDLPKVPVNIIQQLTEKENFKGSVVLVGQPQPTESVVAGIQAGAKGCLSLNLPGEDFISRLRLLARGDFVVCQDMNFGLGPRKEEAKGVAETNSALSGREREVLVLVSTGATNKEIAQELIITENTVKGHLRHILDKLDLRNRQQLAAYAVREGIIKEIDEREEQGALI